MNEIPLRKELGGQQQQQQYGRPGRGWDEENFKLFTAMASSSRSSTTSGSCKLFPPPPLQPKEGVTAETVLSPQRYLLYKQI
jgi:hypothetical protein